MVEKKRVVEKKKSFLEMIQKREINGSSSRLPLFILLFLLFFGVVYDVVCCHPVYMEYKGKEAREEGTYHYDNHRYDRICGNDTDLLK